MSWAPSAPATRPPIAEVDRWGSNGATTAPSTDGTALTVVAYGEAALLVTVSGADAETRWRCAHRLAERLEAERGLATIATYDTVLVEFDPITTGFDEVAEGVFAAPDATNGHEPRPRRRVIVPVVYGGEYGPDLDAVADALGLAPAELVRRHHENAYVVRCVVSPAGAPMTDAPDLPRPVPRRSNPRTAVPGGSVALAGGQAMVYATASPGGWQLIGRTPARLIDPHEDPPVRFRPGDLIEYRPVDAERWDELLGAPVEVRDA